MAGRHARPPRRATHAGTFALQRQSVSPGARARRRARLRRRTRRAAATTAALAGTLTLGLFTGGGTLALWTGASAHDAGVISPGEASIAIEGTEIEARNMLPGEIRGTVLEIENTGAADLELTAVLAASAQPFEVRLALDHAGCGTSPLVGALPLDATTAVAFGELDAGESAGLCVEVTALPEVSPRDELAFHATVSGALS